MRKGGLVVKRLFGCLLAVCMVFSRCGNLFDGHYTSVKPHEQQSNFSASPNVFAANYEQLYAALTEFVQTGREQGVIIVDDYAQSALEQDMKTAITDAMNHHPITAYAVEHISFELGKSGGKKALDVDIEYTHNWAEILKIRRVRDVAGAVKVISGALNQCQTDVVLQIEQYEKTDFTQVVESYALENPQCVMEVPQVTVNLYPKSGKTRVVELRFTYQTSRASLRNMQERVQQVFESAALYVSADAPDEEKYVQLYSFLMERYEYKIETSITPTYSLLRHGVGDSHAFAMVYAAMCRQVGLECIVVCGTKAGASHYWNIVCDQGNYYHVDLLDGEFWERTDEEMSGVVWDYSSYPACGKSA